MKNLFNLDNLGKKEIIEIINLATEYKKGKVKDYSNKKVANLFYEPSTRTNYSFVSAQNNFNMKVVNVNVDASSTKKGESLYDTAKTFEAIGYDMLVIRHSQNDYYQDLRKIKIPIISGGDGTKNHPSQSLLDLMSIYEKFGKFEGLNVTIMGDIAHSRVAHTNIKIMSKLGMNVSVSGPREFYDGSCQYAQFDNAIENADVLMLLRVQFERHNDNLKISNSDYFKKFGLKMNHVNKMKDDAIIMHPAPFNRNIEIADDVVECSKSVIFEQMTNGVYIRMALIDMVLSHDS
ncbi:MAG: aspartate carbamoyltransferase catalytic subunit [Bacilli bacterium]